VLADTILDPKEGVLPYNRAFGTDQPLYYWMQRPENAFRLQRFGLGMQGTAATEPPDAIFTGACWVPRYLVSSIRKTVYSGAIEQVSTGARCLLGASWSMLVVESATRR
jgi:hypothetical protein